MHVCADDVQGSVHEIFLKQHFFHSICPNLSVDVMAQTLSKYRTKSHNTFIVVQHFIYRQFP